MRKVEEVAAAQAREAVAAGIAPGMVLGIGGKCAATEWIGVFGDAAVRPLQVPMGADTLFDLASLTKVLATTALVMKYWEAGRLDLDAPLGELLPSYYPTDKRSLTILQLLTHTAGLPAEIRLRHELAPEPQGDPESARRTVVERMLRAECQCDPGIDFRYSDLGPIYVADLIEQLFAERLDRLFDNEIADPLGLGDTFYIHLDEPLAKAVRAPESFAATEECAWRRRLIAGQVHDENAYLLRGVAGHAGLFSCVADLVILARAYLSPSDTPGFPRQQTVSYFTEKQSNALPRAIGWAKADPAASSGRHLSPAAFGHTGFTGTSMWIDPTKDLFVILLTNRIHPSRDNDAILSFRPRLHDAVLVALGKD